VKRGFDPNDELKGELLREIWERISSKELVNLPKGMPSSSKDVLAILLGKNKKYESNPLFRLLGGSMATRFLNMDELFMQRW
jgi:hypothetical protein